MPVGESQQTLYSSTDSLSDEDTKIRSCLQTLDALDTLLQEEDILDNLTKTAEEKM